ncbi:MAG: YlxM family DNA-binding protein [Lachnospiraceae bacterium]
MEKIFEQGLLYDFYGDLLTPHQQKIYEDAVYGDLSLSEIAEQQNISRQGVHDLLKRCDKILSAYESKLHLVERFQKTKDTVRQIKTLAEESKGLLRENVNTDEITEKLTKIEEFSVRLLDE